MIFNKLTRIARYSQHILFRTQHSNRALNTQIFHSMDDRTLATPELAKLAVTKRIPFHSRLSSVGLYHGKRVRHAIKSCFS